MIVGGPMIRLSNGVNMPQVGLGTWMMKPEEANVAVRTAIETGYRLIDTAEVYRNENAIGETIKALIQEGKVRREELFIITKLYVNHLHPNDTESSIRGSLQRLQLAYVDLYLAHGPACFNHEMTEHLRSVTVQDIWRGMEGVYKKGLAKAIGVCNWNGEQIERVLRTAQVPIHNCQAFAPQKYKIMKPFIFVQSEIHLYWPEHELQDICRRHNISLTSYGSLGSPGRVNFQLPGGPKLEWAPAPNPMEDPCVRMLAAKYSKTPAQILLRYVLERNIAVIPKSVHPSRIVENFQLFDFALSADDMRLLESVKYRQRLFVHNMCVLFLFSARHIEKHYYVIVFVLKTEFFSMEGHPEDPLKNERKIELCSC
ncbi:unnamed protein product [Heligmosomoides polygyrus]|uniref:Aldo_ket_red domain-containing protein n=1 Tax=Heligmosomoides polygyrus TaxID=6339 RepID=A0A3P7ZXY1_HELPZ|nr:unnamed protein product [Heligmosomoides polygyrus]